MNFTFQNKKIEGILTILPKKTINFDDEIMNYNFTYSQSIKLKKIMGYNKRRIVTNESSAELCFKGVQHALKYKLINKEKIDAIIVVTQTPDYLIPPTSNLIQSKFKFREDIICLDINQGCAGFIIGLWQSFILLNQKPISNILLFNVDTLSKKVSKKDRNSNPIIGDAASMTLVRNVKSKNKFFFNIKMFNKNNLALNIPAGGSKIPFSKKTSILSKDQSGNCRSLNDLVMQGDIIFNFVLNEVPKVILDNINYSDFKLDDIDKFFFHQPNKFTLEKLINALQIPLAKVPINIVEKFGNSSGATIPLNIAHNIDKIFKKKIKVCMAGFGSGLTAASLITDLPKLKFCKII